MHLLIIIGGLLLFTSTARAEMVRNDAIGNDPSKEKLCAARAKGKPVPFEIDSRYVESARSFNPDATFIAIDGANPQLVECFRLPGTGKYEPASFSPEQSYWHLIRPKQFEPGIHNSKGISMAANVCLEAAPLKINRPNLDHSVYSSVVEVHIGSPSYHPGALIAGKKAERYDIAVKGTSFYKSSGPDLLAVHFTCLLSPMLDVKAIQFK
ncbi:MAG TPA: hypothetical protein VK149_10010 [Sideroxyarcus sp.]|nr:hypothetical protein [Sideroxyarcus sp.]